ncbi:MAG TPA: GlsB/YeaQ/YmgE family stress response membrane protein [Casimicrobiaceae bacterium]|nr:GlsB/YeaQ/YmgE family stress response membrane protein [Casimicrobiaceae bacterium]
MLHIIWMIIVGFIVGVIARFVYPGAVAMGFWLTAVLGIVGSIVGGLIGRAIWRPADGRFHPAGFLLSIVGALIVLWLYFTFVGRT